ncbi:hypothetical protein TMatcc_007884 [Talaromyces marneffei ATCC 18224]|uniref:Uncharacterized protein n=1 Tax=Talaromyces marneffei (strain ATCC 18224 / CBS 334.59 / QM 7333) TaxID=441960 RepID=B6QDF3_TALMQ|nr:uncharacterized protein EYB26_004799 [Talaromyces marneffei]EEA24781.1 hypothetical protein PMAA_087590 [Talaromyces marneffei ATCC 18224]KAE8552735.1 hypothetical protein EYB25_004114 [Talaromyces marneffei]QGA17129.1 hypothetical protein EYB26_004799 [Talaromyces marneffei]
MVEIDSINNIRYRLRIKDAPEPSTPPDSEISSRLKLKEGKHHLVLVVEKARKKMAFPAPPGEYSNYEKLFDATTQPQQAVAYLNLTLEPNMSLIPPEKAEWYNCLDGYTIDLGEIEAKQGHKSLSITGDIGEEARKKHGQVRREFEPNRMRQLIVIEVNLKFGLDVTS